VAKSERKEENYEYIMNGNIDNKNDAREAFAKVSKDKETVTEVDDDMVKNSTANPLVISDKQGSYPIEFTDVTSAEDDDQFKPHKASLGSKCPKFKPPDATAPNLTSQTQNAETAFKDEENFFENNPSLMENVPSKTAAEIYDEFEEKVEEFEDIVHVVDQLEEPPDAETMKELAGINKTVRKLAADLKVDPSFTKTYPDVGPEFKSLMKSAVKKGKICQSAEAAQDKY